MEIENKKKKIQSRYMIDFGDDKIFSKKLYLLLESLNRKKYGSVLTIKNLVRDIVENLNEKQKKRIIESSYSDMDKVSIELEEYNKSNNQNLSLGKYLVKKLKIKN